MIYQKVEMYVHRSGYRAPHEPVATHARRRFRLTPLDPNAPPPDSSLWIMHYCQADPQNRIPSNTIRVSDQVRQLMSERMQLQQRQHQLIRKEFMLRDSASWPTVNLPGISNPQYPTQPMGYPGDVISHMNRSQQQAYMQQQQQQQQAQAVQAAQRGIGPSPAKRPRHGAPSHGHGSMTAIPPPAMPRDPDLIDEDGGDTGDLMDFLTPRDISLHRYVQHHEWLEEILHSPYDTSQIIPGELGLGKKGELESLTKDFFDAPTEPTSKEEFEVLPNQEQTSIHAATTPRVGRLEIGKAVDFAKRASERVAAINAEMEKLKRQHARRMAKLTKGRAYKQAQEELRNSTLDMINGDAGRAGQGSDSKVEQIVSKMEDSIGKSIKPVSDVECIEKGGLEEKARASDIPDQDYDMVDNFGQYDGVGVEVPAPSAPSDQLYANQAGSASATPQEQEQEQAQPEVLHHENANMNERRPSTENKDQAPEEWVMVSKDENFPAENQDHNDQDLGDLDSFANDAVMQPIMDTPVADDNTAGGDMQDFEQGAVGDTTGNFEVTGFDEGIDFGDLDTAGDGLAGYDEGIENTGLGGQGNLGPEDTAFGDAFPDTEADAGQEEQQSGP